MTKAKTEKLGIEVDGNAQQVGGVWEVDNLSKGYHGLIETWWIRFGLVGNGFIIGESGESAKAVKEKLKRERKEIKDVWSVDLADADYNWDITYPLPLEGELVDWIICQAVIEHVIDPTGAIGNLVDVLIPGGRLYLHSVSVNFPEHRYPTDCFRFFRDALIGWAERFNLEIDDMIWTPKHWFVLYRKKI